MTFDTRHNNRLSGWPEILSTPTRSSHAGARGLMACMRKFFETLRVPEQLSSDGSHEFTANATSEFLEKWGIKHSISSAYNPQLNLAGRSSGEICHDIAKINYQSLNSDRLLRALLQLRNTPDPDCHLSPAQIMYGPYTGCLCKPFRKILYPPYMARSLGNERTSSKY